MRVFIAHSSEDTHYASQLVSALNGLDIEASYMDTLVPSARKSIDELLRAELLRCDALVVLWSEHTARSKSVVVEIGFHMGLAGNKPVFPVILDDSRPPAALMDRIAFLHNTDPEDVALNIASKLSVLEGQKKQSRIVAEQRKEEVERSSEKYIAESLKSLNARERKYQILAYVCYLLGYATVLGGLIYAVLRITQEPPKFADVSQAIYVSTLTLTAIGFLAAASRFAFVLGKSFMVESLRNHDRIHAMQFGEFYLKAFGENAQWDELKEAFQHWNLDSGSTFKDQKEDSVDPQVLRLLNDLIKSVGKTKG